MPPGVPVENRAFDITPAGLVTALVTEEGVVSPVTAAAVAEVASVAAVAALSAGPPPVSST